MDNTTLKNRDLKHIWHPCSQMKDYENNMPLIAIKKAKGVYLYDYDGNKYIDGISSWWVNNLGHNNKKISKALKKQINSLSHTIFAGFTHKKAIELSEKIISISPKGLNKVFFADNGSSAVDIALKICFHYHKLNNKIKPSFISLKNSYHGESIGAMSISDVDLYKKTYKEIISEHLQIDVPKDKDDIKRCIKEADDLLNLRDDISAIIIEPLVQCAGNMQMYHKDFIVRLREICDKYDIFLIADEIATGFGKTGKMFAIDKAKVSPDIMLVSKALTGGYMPLSLVLCTNKIYDKFYDDYNTYKAFLHSHSYSGNALSCACACANIDLMNKKSTKVKIEKNSSYMAKRAKKFKKLTSVSNIRQEGMIVAMDIDFDIKDRVNIDIYNYCLQNGVLLRPLANTLYFMPQIIIKKKQIKKMMNVAYDAIVKFCENKK